MDIIDNIPMITIEEGKSIEEDLVAILIERNLIIATAESCTGGLIASRLVNVSGVSAVFKQGFITYDNTVKHEILGVPLGALAQYGAVSSIVAGFMAEGVASAATADIGLASTGIAGPDGGTQEKPVGLVYIGICFNNQTYVRECRFTGNRQEIRELTVVNGLNMLLQLLKSM